MKISNSDRMVLFVKYNQSYILAVEDKNEVFPAMLDDFHLDFFR